MIKIITTNSYFNIFNVLTEELKGVSLGLSGKNYVFCEEKISLLTERTISACYLGAFNTSVYSFGNYYAVNKRAKNTVSKEFASMVIRKLLSNLPLKTFNKNKQNLAPTIFELIIQLKSANVTVCDLELATKNTKGLLKNKLLDVLEVFTAYENYLKERDLTDQSAQLSFLKEIVKEDACMKGANVFVVGFMGFTAQIKEALLEILKTAKNVTFILTDGENKGAFVGETALVAKKLCERLSLSYTFKTIKTEYSKESEIIVNNLFAPTKIKAEKIDTDKIFVGGYFSTDEQARKICSIIKESVIDGKIRYKDVTIACVEPKMKDSLVKEFSLSGVPFALDDRKKPDNHPLVSLIYSYIEVFRKNFERESLLSFIKNPLVSNDKDLTDGFENYIYKYGVNYAQIKKPFTLELENPLTLEYEKMRAVVCSFLEYFSPLKLLEKLNVKEKLKELSNKLDLAGEKEISAVNEQIYAYVVEILNQINVVFEGEKIGYKEYKEVFSSGISALKISILPQYNDAVFVGDFKECAMVRAKYLFLAGLDDQVPGVKADVALLTDGDINALTESGVIIEPKIKIVNQRIREQTLLGVSAFSEKLFALYTSTSKTGNKNSQCDVVNFLYDTFNVSALPKTDEYLSLKSALRAFSVRCGEFANGLALELGEASAFYELNAKDCEKIVNRANKDVALCVNKNQEILASSIVSPTAIEEFYSCPYKYFISHGLKVKEREEDTVNALSFGNIAHEILQYAISKIDKLKTDEDVETALKEVKEKILADSRYSKFLNSPKSLYEVKEAFNETKKFLDKTLILSKKSAFKLGGGGLEVKFGKGGAYPEIPLLNGQVNLSGKIDRVDVYKDYCRVIDYKTGKVDDSEKSLFNGTKLQLYLYAMAIKDKKLAGAYYMPIKDGFDLEESPLLVGKNLDNDEILRAQDEDYSSGESKVLPLKAGRNKNVTTEQNLNALLKYAKLVCEKAITHMKEGFVAPTPYDGACEYCAYKAFCSNKEGVCRKIGAVSEEFIADAVKSEATDE